ncbi:hypothetical protein X769_21980 [Mesorhizobium sp. LSJC268A00]|nr:hypothetical protein X769_21980 [Mesorhizobium sp. LSJC268A00]ESX12611.1 hypothetical protein X766_30225 [Mesorhizobium sp. LSJC255A00]ESX32806.1 hypothetical protein X765_00945 [Mesorhizobium sp. LSHC440B00]ESX33801.1 hypothetical protein X764_29145 [Mesorhizobium sp. LSHC440A00]ESX40127.1 hypothetical protein X763_07465 [Mesorhizobium sp. LSHC432A00]ESY34622.1 hypothetical protein X747_29515 [Mesorhizobium sp. LNJC384A00]ESY51732.1 hypothetical protein X745_23075 [Mesorhizobium sp. LNJC3
MRPAHCPRHGDGHVALLPAFAHKEPKPDANQAALGQWEQFARAELGLASYRGASMQDNFDRASSVAEVAESFVRSRRPFSVVSTRDAVTIVRKQAAFCEHTDGELAELVAAIAVRHGRLVAFDLDLDDTGLEIGRAA